MGASTSPQDEPPVRVPPPMLLDEIGLEDLLEALRAQGFLILGPRVRDGAIVHDEIASIADLPRGWTEEQDGGRYRLQRREDEALFGYALGPHSWKRYLHVPQQRLSRTVPGPDGATTYAEPPKREKVAFLGVRACDLHAMAIQDRVLLGGSHPDPHYATRRSGVLLIAVNCGSPGGTCFCASMGTGPGVTLDHDILLTELLDDGPQRFLATAGSQAGQALLEPLAKRPATASDIAAAEAVTARATAAMGRTMPAANLHDLLLSNLTHPRWDEVAQRCLTCGNCTMVCPTCFCTSVTDGTDLSDGATVRTQHWASCFTLDYSYIHGGSVRSSARARYRQWISHKLATWYDQFGSSGCVGCGRCITWCPVGIDITEEVAALHADAPT